MIEKLLNEANEEATHKAFCDEELSKSRASQEEKTMKLDKYSARGDSATTTMAELEEAIKGLQGEIAELNEEIDRLRERLLEAEQAGEAAEAKGAQLEELLAEEKVRP